MGNSKKEEGGRREEMDRDKTVGKGWKRKHAVKLSTQKTTFTTVLERCF